MVSVNTVITGSHKSMYKNILIIADIEGSTGCAGYEASSFNTSSWYDACIEMSLDIDFIVTKLFEKGADKVYVRDFHRTGYNLLPELIDERADIIHGYKEGPVPGIGEVYDSEAVMFIGFHASSGSGGFIAHTLTSRYKRILVNNKRVSELQLFASSLYRFSIKPVFFSGCPVACMEAEEDIRGINVFPVIKDESGQTDKIKSRSALASAAADSLDNTKTAPYTMHPPFNIELQMRDGANAAEKTAARWGLKHNGSSITFTAENFDSFYRKLVSITYLTPLLEKIAPAALNLFNLYGRYGLFIVRRRRSSEIKKRAKKIT